MDRNKSRCTCLGLYADIISSVVCEIALSALNGQFAYAATSMSYIFCTVKYKITVDGVLIFIVLYQLKAVNSVKPLFLIVGIVIDPASTD